MLRLVIYAPTSNTFGETVLKRVSETEVEDKWEARRRLNKSYGSYAELYRPNGRVPIAAYAPKPGSKVWVRTNPRRS
jgi:hypothetical protein